MIQNFLKAIGITLLIVLSIALLISLVYVFVWVLLGAAIVTILFFIFGILKAQKNLE